MKEVSMDNRIALSNFKHTVLVALVDLRDATDPEEWGTAKLDAMRVLGEVIDLNRSNPEERRRQCNPSHA